MSRYPVAFALMAALLAPVPAAANAPGIGVVEALPPSGAAFVPGEVIVKYRAGARATARAAARGAAAAVGASPVVGPDTELLRLQRGKSVSAAVAALGARADVEYAQPNYLYRMGATPDDSFFSKQWGLHNTGQSHLTGGGTADADIDAPEAWEVTTGSADVVVAVVDTGVDLDHPDLVGNLIGGWDFVGGDGMPDDEHGHGTHVAGIVGARGDNGKGVAGVNWNVSIMPVRVLNEDGVGSTAAIAAGFTYAADNGARIVNASLGANVSVDAAMRDAIRGAPDTLFVVAAGNDGKNVEVKPSYPCVESAANVICVAATDDEDNLASFSNYGSTSVDLGAPGDSIASTYWPGACSSGYCYSSGTSMATPFVAGAAALYLSVEPSAFVAQVRDALLGRGDPIAALTTKTVTGKRLNVHRALPAGGMKLSHSSGFSWVTEAGQADTIRVRLTTRPSAPVSVELLPGAGLAIVSPGSVLTFTPEDWGVDQDVVVRSAVADDLSYDGRRSDTVAFEVTSADSEYDGLVVPSAVVSITDHEDVDPSSATDFVDDDGSVFEYSISWLSAARITHGCTSTHFCPSRSVTRGQMAAFLSRALGLPPTSRDHFHDDDGTTFERDINRLAASGITLGCGPGRFCPSQDVTRGQMATFLRRALSLNTVTIDYFIDDNTSPFEVSINALRHAGITSGCSSVRFCPSSDVTRAQMAAFLYRALG